MTWIVIQRHAHKRRLSWLGQRPTVFVATVMSVMSLGPESILEVVLAASTTDEYVIGYNEVASNSGLL